MDFIDAIQAEVVTRLNSAPLAPLTTIYLGGGTPSKLGGDGIVRLFDTIRATAGVIVSDDAELTIEANPEDVSEVSVAAWVSAGVNRLSLGSQSFDPKVLAWMHRGHGPEAVGQAVEIARAGGIDDISVDLIFALPDTLDRDWERDLAYALELGPDHVSLYGLTVEPHTPLGRWTARGEVDEAPEERYADEFLTAHRTLVAAGFEHYEVSNYGRPGRHSRHNSAYWRHVPYLGVGPSAHSYDGAGRRWNEREYEAWRRRAMAGEDPVSGHETLTAANIAAEQVYLGLRTSGGLDLSGGEFETATPWIDAGWAELTGTRLRLTPDGWLRLDSIAAILTSSRSL